MWATTLTPGGGPSHFGFGVLVEHEWSEGSSEGGSGERCCDKRCCW